MLSWRGAVWVLIFVCGTAHAQDYLTQTGSPTFSSPERGARRLRANERNLRILDVDSGKTVSEINTGYIAAAVAFIGQDRVASVSANPDVKHFDKDTIKIWDVETGRLIRQISSESGGVHDTVLVSGDRRVVLGYVGSISLLGTGGPTGTTSRLSEVSPLESRYG